MRAQPDARATTRRAFLALGLAALLLTAGCFGLGGDEAEGNDTPERNNTTPTAEDEEEREQWTRENRSGSVPATSTLVGEEAAEESFEVNGSALVLNLSAEGGELEMCIQKPSGNESGNASQDSCDETQTTEDGNATYETTEPEAGNWTVRLSASEASSSEVEYELVIAQKTASDTEEEVASTAVRKAR